jgi:decaprenylphospho-beta-D-erythro-pentofuranosid-2-ulose 2-reductase
MKNVLILGASSGMARALGRLLCSDARLILAGNDPEVLGKIATDLELRSNGNAPVVAEFDARDTSGHGAFVAKVANDVGPINEAYVFFGVMVDEAAAHQKPELAIDMMLINYVGAVSVMEHLAAHMETNKFGLIAAVSSVAGDRGRSSNYLYGSTKAGLSAYLSGLRARMQAFGVHVMTVKPGFVDTPMTASIKKGPLFSAPEKIATGIIKSAAKRRNSVYLPGFWTLIMLIIIHIPEGIFKKLKF